MISTNIHGIFTWACDDRTALDRMFKRAVAQQFRRDAREHTWTIVGASAFDSDKRFAHEIAAVTYQLPQS